MAVGKILRDPTLLRSLLLVNAALFCPAALLAVLSVQTARGRYSWRAVGAFALGVAALFFYNLGIKAALERTV